MTYNADINFDSIKLRTEANILSTICNQIFVEAY